MTTDATPVSSTPDQKTKLASKTEDEAFASALAGTKNKQKETTKDKQKTNSEPSIER